MGNAAIRIVAPVGLVIGTVCGMAGSFVAAPTVRSLLWGIDGTALVVATALLTVHHLRRGNDLVAAGFLVFVAGQTLVLATAAMDLVAGIPLMGTGAALWAAALLLVSAARVMALWLRAVGVIAALMFVVFALQVFTGHELTALSRPVPFFAYPFLSVTLLGWAWTHYRNNA